MHLHSKPIEGARRGRRGLGSVDQLDVSSPHGVAAIAGIGLPDWRVGGRGGLRTCYNADVARVGAVYDVLRDL